MFWGGKTARYQGPLNLYLQKQNLIPGARITVLEVVEYTGVVSFKKKDKTIALGLKAAHTIWVRPV